MKLNKRGRISQHISPLQAFLIALLVAIMGFFLTLSAQRTEQTSKTNIYIDHLGFPFEVLKITNNVGVGYYVDIGQIVSVQRTYDLLWLGIAGNIIIYTMTSTIIVKLGAWIRNELEYRKYYSR